MPSLLTLTTVPETTLAFLRPYGSYFRKAGWRVDAGARNLSSHSVEIANNFDTVHDLPWSRSLYSLANYTRACRVLRKLVERGNYDLVHVHSPIASFLTRFALRNRRQKTRVIYTAHGFHFGFSGKSPVFSPYFYFEKLAGNWTDALIVINRDDYNVSLARNIVPRKNLIYMPGIGVDLSFYSREKVPPMQIQSIRSALGLGSKDFLFLMVAEFSPGKRHADLLQALKLVGRPDVHLALAGEGRILNETKNLAGRLGLTSRTHFLGFRRDVPALMAAADATVLPSEREGLPRCLMESMAMNTPVLGSRIRGITELLSEDCGLMFKVGNLPEIAECLIQAIEGKEALARMAANARRKVDRYDLTGILENHFTLYSSLLESRLTSQDLSLSRFVG